MNISTRILSMLALWVVSLLARAGTVTYVYTDPQGTPLAEADATGTITAKFDYAPYGAASTASGMSGVPNGPGYTGHVNDPESGFVYMQARYYDPGTGRFLSVDPIRSAAGNVYSFSRYAYANNNPIVKVDPDGRFTLDTHSSCSMYNCQTIIGSVDGGGPGDSSTPPSISLLPQITDGSQKTNDSGDDTKGEQAIELTEGMVEEIKELSKDGFFENVAFTEVADMVGNGISAAAAAKKYGDLSAGTLNMIMANAIGSIQQYKVMSVAFPDPSGIDGQGGVLHWGKVQWAPFDPGGNRTPEQILRNFVHAKEATLGT